MIAKLRGIVDTLGDDYVILDVNGVGYLVFCSSRTLSKLPREGGDATLYIETHVREDHIHLYGFADALEKHWFLTLGTVQGVGAKVGLAILSALPADKISHALMSGDKAAFAMANGVGPKLAMRIITELKDKAGVDLSSASGGIVISSSASVSSSAPMGGVIEDAVSALVNLGYQRLDAYGTVSSLHKELGENATVEILIKQALHAFAKKG